MERQNNALMFNNNWKKLEEIFNQQSKENDIILNEFCSNLEKNNKKNLSIKLKELKKILNNEKFMKSASMYRNNFVIDTDEHAKYTKDVKKYLIELGAKATNLDRPEYGDCGEYATQIMKKLIEKNLELKKSSSTNCFFKNFFIVKTAESHRFVVLVTQTDELILVDGWAYNLICNFDTKDILSYASLDCLRDMEIDIEIMRIVYESFYNSNTKVNSILNNLEKKSVLLLRFMKIKEDLKYDNEIRLQFKQRCEKDLTDVLDLIGNKKDSNLFGKTETVFHLLKYVNDGAQGKDKIVLNSEILEKVLLKIDNSEINTEEISKIKNSANSLQIDDEGKEKLISSKITKEIDGHIRLAILQSSLNINVNDFFKIQGLNVQ